MQEQSPASRHPSVPRARAVLLDYGGVLAEEGFREGLHQIARSQGIDPRALHRAAVAAVYDTGYVTGQGSEREFWDRLRAEFGLEGSEAALSQVILAQFLLRPRMVEAVRRLRAGGVLCGLLSDQTPWLDRLDARDGFYREFDRLYISYRLGKGKNDPGLFDQVVEDLGLAAGEVAFADDDPGNVERARSRGLLSICFRSQDQALAEISALTGLALA